MVTGQGRTETSVYTSFPLRTAFIVIPPHPHTVLAKNLTLHHMHIAEQHDIVPDYYTGHSQHPPGVLNHQGRLYPSL